MLGRVPTGGQPRQRPCSRTAGSLSRPRRPDHAGCQPEPLLGWALLLGGLAGPHGGGRAEGGCGCPPTTLQGRGHSARSPEPFGSSSARKAIGDEHVPAPVADTEDLRSTLSLRGPQPVPLGPQPRVALKGEPSWRRGPEAWHLCEAPVPGCRLHWSVRGALGEWDRGQGLCGATALWPTLWPMLRGMRVFCASSLKLILPQCPCPGVASGHPGQHGGPPPAAGPVQVSGRAVAELGGRSWARQVWPRTQIRPQPQGP